MIEGHTVVGSAMVTDAHALAELRALARPLGSLVLWAEQLGDLEFVDIPPVTAQLLKVNDQVLARVERETFGTLPLSVLFVRRRPVLPSRLDELFRNTRFAYVGSYGASNLADNRYSPGLYFVIAAVLRDIADPERGRVGVDGLSLRLGGALPAVSHDVEPTSWRAERRFQVVLREQLTEGRV